MALNPDLQFGFNFAIDQSLNNLVSGNPNAVNSARTAQFNATLGLIIDGTLDDVTITMTDEMVGSQGSFYIAYQDTIPDAVTSSIFQMESAGPAVSGIVIFHFQPGSNDNTFTRMVFSVTAVASFSVVHASADVTRRIAAYWNTTEASMNANYDGVAQTPDTSLATMDFEDQIIYLGSDGVGVGGAELDGTIETLYIYSSEDGGTGDRDQWIDDLANDLIFESSDLARGGGGSIRHGRHQRSRSMHSRGRRR